MTAQPTTHPMEIMDEAAALARERVSGEDLDLALAFLGCYYTGTSPDDLAERKAGDLYGAAMAHLNLARRRAPGTPKIRVYNPRIEQHGWQSTHTIVEIVTDDLPFLVDSVRMVLNAARLYQPPRHPSGPARPPRRQDGSLEAVAPGRGGQRAKGTGVEAVVHIETDRQTERDVLDAIATEMRCRSRRRAGRRWRTGAACASGCAGASSRSCDALAAVRRRRRNGRR